MTNVHCKLLVLISKYGQMPVADEPETWIRELPLLVLVYEGITAGVFEMDYSPQCMTMSHTGVTRRMFLNISQEAKSAIDELREQKLISALKISSEDLQSVTAFQVGEYGRKLMSHTGVTRSMFLNSRSSSLSSSSPRSVSPYLSDTLHPSPFTSHSSLPLARPSSLPPPALPPSVSLTLSQASLHQCAHIHKKPVRVSIPTRAR